MGRNPASIAVGLLVAVACDGTPSSRPVEAPREAAEPASAAGPSVAAAAAPAPDRAAPSDTAPSQPAPKEAASGEPAPSEAPVADASLQLATLGLRARAPEGTETVPAAVEGGILVRGPDLFVVVLPDPTTRPATLEDATRQVARISSRAPITESLSDGWVLTLEASHELGPVQVAQVRRELAGTVIWCESVVTYPEQRDRAVSLCKSLTP
ncbi:MAG: hypothetical protein AB1Z98_08565 [Nannocystaceae bacterium]